ncbi:MAG TPA: glycosyltransferase family 9 protein, partial [Alphaproteobacteria bacterium]|nr:glycosyltransferase family 9 protein [Alphaproteobacteria bacterium]
EIHWITSNGPTGYATMLREPTKSLIAHIHDQPAWIKEYAQSELNTAPHFDLLIDTRNRMPLAREAKNVPHEIFLGMAWRGFFSTKRPSLLRPKPRHLVDRLLDMVEQAAGYVPASTGALPVPENLLNDARKILPPSPTYVGLAPGAGHVIKIWPRYKFEKVAALQAAKGRVPVFILGPQEQASFDALSGMVPTAKFPLQEYNVWGSHQLTIEHTLAIAQQLKVAVANDSGVGHMLAAADTPLISLFGPTSPEKLAPRTSRSRIIRAQAFGGHEMKKITWEAVDAVIDEMLAT